MVKQYGFNILMLIIGATTSLADPHEPECNGGKLVPTLFEIACDCSKVFQQGELCDSALSDGLVNETFITVHILYLNTVTPDELKNIASKLNIKSYIHTLIYDMFYNMSDVFIVVHHANFRPKKESFVIERNKKYVTISKANFNIRMPDIKWKHKEEEKKQNMELYIISIILVVNLTVLLTVSTVVCFMQNKRCKLMTNTTNELEASRSIV